MINIGRFQTWWPIKGSKFNGLWEKSNVSLSMEGFKLSGL